MKTVKLMTASCWFQQVEMLLWIQMKIHLDPNWKPSGRETFYKYMSDVLLWFMWLNQGRWYQSISSFHNQLNWVFPAIVATYWESAQQYWSLCKYYVCQYQYCSLRPQGRVVGSQIQPYSWAFHSISVIIVWLFHFHTLFVWQCIEDVRGTP